MSEYFEAFIGYVSQKQEEEENQQQSDLMLK